MTTNNVAFLGIGRMGSAMAANIAHADYPIRVWNRTRQKAEAMRQYHAQVANSAVEAVEGADIVCCIVTNAEAVESVLFGERVAEAMKPGAIFVNMSSIPPKAEKAHAKALREQGRRHLDAPVSGGTRGAADGALAIMVGGDKAAFLDAIPVLSSMGHPTRVGPDGTGQLAKLCNQAIVAIGVGALSESMLLAAAGGADPASVREALRGGFAESRLLQEHGSRMLERNWVPGGQVRNMLKDLHAVIEAAEDCGITLPFVTLARSLYQSLHDRGIEGHDHTALLLELEHMNPPHRVTDKPDIVPEG